MSGRPRLNKNEIVQYLLDNPTVSAKEAGDHFHCHEVTVKLLANKAAVYCTRENRWHRKVV